MAAPRRIAMVSMHTSPAAQAGTGDAGGMNVVLLETARALVERGYEVDLLTRCTGRAETVELAPGLTLRALPAGGELPKEQLAEAADAFGEAVAELAGRRGSGYELLHAHYWLSGIATLPVALELGIPFVQSFHTLAVMKNRTLGAGEAPEPELRRRSERFLANQASAVVAGSRAEALAVLDDLGAPADQTWVVSPGVDTEMFRPRPAGEEDEVALRKSLRISAERPILTMAGRLQPLKGHELALRALAMLGGLRNRPVLVVAGEPTPGQDSYLRGLEHLADNLGVRESVRFVGALDRQALSGLLASSALTLMPSRSETFGLVALESAACGTPVLASRSTGLAESVSDGHSGILLDGRDPGRWAQVVAALLGDPVRLAALARSARQHAQRHGWGDSADALVEVYTALLG
jgi:D-inositol-3-phosphate glycosyltransferase